MPQLYYLQQHNLRSNSVAISRKFAEFTLRKAPEPVNETDLDKTIVCQAVKTSQWNESDNAQTSVSSGTKVSTSAQGKIK
ncbi:hypothetical protein K0M31_008944 [Melipona bicolor]|uniref:Uncharacterized protein n=1 Tax=Melipona bicolor TaxID=60889 RepID=A0AA40FQW2_9HYME|nr:hypothetical protein K0M31_008944 [Melipona bicolor]